MKKKVLAIIFLIIIVLECAIIYIKENSLKDKVEEKEYVNTNEETKITIIDILNNFEENPSINLISIDDKIENYEVNISITENKNEFLKIINSLNDFKIIDYNINLEQNNINGVFKLQCAK
ncbi:MAG: hypothetical protein SOY42_12775 [Clostridium sp.]|nr:hypothetical protein [Clostridium sp.]